MKNKCRACKGETSQKRFLFKCVNKECGAVFWHRKILSENLEDDSVFKKQLSLAEIPPTKNKDHFVYVIQLSRKENEVEDSVYVGRTWRHPYERYLWHLSNKNSQGSSHVIKRGKVMIDYEGPMSKQNAIAREKSLAYALEDKYLVKGGH